LDEGQSASSKIQKGEGAINMHNETASADGMTDFPPGNSGEKSLPLELTALGVLSKVAKERGWLVGKPFEVADAQALLRHLEAALPAALKRQAERNVADGTAKIYLARLPSGNIEFTTVATVAGSPSRETFQITEAEASALRTKLDAVLAPMGTSQKWCRPGRHRYASC
jgi:hypothetical protein